MSYGYSAGRRWGLNSRGNEYVPPRVPFGSAEDSFDYDEERRRWAQGLTDFDLRALASDYYRGVDTSEAAEDAYHEFRRRSPSGKLRRAAGVSIPNDPEELPHQVMIDDERQAPTGDQGIMQPTSR